MCPRARRASPRRRPRFLRPTAPPRTAGRGADSWPPLLREAPRADADGPSHPPRSVRRPRRGPLLPSEIHAAERDHGVELVGRAERALVVELAADRQELGVAREP